MCLLNNLHLLPLTRRIRSHGNPFRSAPIAVTLAVCAALPAFAGQAPQPQITPARTAHHHHALLKESPSAEPAVPALVPTAPKWPANEAPGKPEITWDSHGLRITAANSSLHQILDQVSTATGAKVEGMGPDERVFGSYGPGDARDVLSQLLHGSSYNVLMIGDQGKGTPREIVLSARNSGGSSNNHAAASNPNNPDAQEDEAPEPPEQDDQSPTPQLMQPPMPGPPGSPGAPRTPQELLQELQQRQQEMQNQQNQQTPDQPVPSPPQE